MSGNFVQENIKKGFWQENKFVLIKNIDATRHSKLYN